MIKVKIFKEGDLYLRFKIKGYTLSRAEIEKVGDTYDIICNSVSVLSRNALIGIKEVSKLKVKYDIDDDFLYISLSSLNNEDTEKCQVLLLTFEKSIESLTQSLKLSFGNKKDSEYIRMLKEEVQ